MLKSGVERQLMIAGEALAQLSRIAPETASQIPDFRQIIAFRNILVHGYATIDDKIVWGILERHLQALRESITTLLKQA